MGIPPFSCCLSGNFDFGFRAARQHTSDRLGTQCPAKFSGDLGDLIISRPIEIPYDREAFIAALRSRRKGNLMIGISRRKIGAVTALPLIFALLSVSVARADEISVVTSGGFTAAYLELVPEYESTTRNKLVTEFGPSMGTTHNAIPIRLGRGESIDVVIMAGPALDDLIKQGKVRPGSRVDLVNSYIGMAVKSGAPKPDISSVDALKRTLLAAKSIAYSDSASGVYLSTELFPKLGIADQIMRKSRKIEADPVGGVVATGEFEIGFQQISELRPVKGIDIVGPLPPGAQRITVFAAGIPTTAMHPEAAKALIEWLASPAAYAAIKKSGLEPANSR
jgi:molybdate transport system substrate-binding protein